MVRFVTAVGERLKLALVNEHRGMPAERLGGAELLRALETRFVAADREDLRRAGELGGLDRDPARRRRSRP